MLDPNFPLIYLVYTALGDTYSSLEMYKESIDPYKQAIVKNPDYLRAYFGLAHSYGQMAMFKGAKGVLKKVISFKPDDATAHALLGITYLGLNDKKAALQEYKILKGLDPQKANLLFELIYE